MISHTDVGYAQKGGSDPGCEPRAVGLKGCLLYTSDAADE